MRVCRPFKMLQGKSCNDLNNWLKINLNNNMIIGATIPSSFLFTATLWFLWKWRCSVVFDCNFETPICPALIIFRYCKEWLLATTLPNKDLSHRTQLGVWQSPKEGWVKINVDGGRNTVNGSIYTGGVLRGYRGVWLGGFSSKIGTGSALEAELWTALEGLQMAWKSGARKVILESDSNDTVNLLLRVSNSNHPLYNLIFNCKELILGRWQCTIAHIFREGNPVVDCLAGLSKNRERRTAYFQSPPPEIASLLECDAGNLLDSV
ncbi:hypothetical protein ACOSQ2_001274 [Xanthoceras sorbifolium]